MYMDQWSKMHVLFPLMHKSASEVALNLSSKVFAYFGQPKLLQSDNGREFVNSIIDNLVKDWPGKVTIISGQALHSQSQALIEHGNAKVEEMLACPFPQPAMSTVKPPGQHGFLRFSVSCFSCTL